MSHPIRICVCVCVINEKVDSAMDVKEDHAVRDEMEAEETTGTEENTNARPWYRGASGVTKKKPSGKTFNFCTHQ